MTLEPFELTEYLDGEDPTEMATAVSRRIERGFYAAPGTVEAQRWRARNNQELGMTTRGFLDGEEAPFGTASPQPVATLTAWDGRVTVGDAVLGSRLISGVGVSPTHRRRGLLRTMMHEELSQAQAAGLPLASLTVSEGGIYGRFGFGVATRLTRYSLDEKAGADLRPGVLENSGAAAGSVHAVAPKDLLVAAREISERAALLRTGAVHRFAGYAENMLRLVRIGEGTTEPDDKVQAYLYRGPDAADGTPSPEGYVVVSHRGWTGLEESVLDVVDFQAATAAAEVALWNLLLHMDLVDRLEYWAAPGGELRQLLINPRALKATGEKDGIWNRILDVRAVLEAREYLAEGEVVLEVTDPVGLIDGAYRLAVRGGVGMVLERADLEETEAGNAASAPAEFAPGVPRARFTAELLATAVFRGCDVEARCGAVTGEGAEVAARLLRPVREPACDVDF